MELRIRMNRVYALRRYLKRNKILFDTVGVLVLSAVGLYVGYQANQIAQSQAELARQQARLEEVRSRPFIRTRIEQLPDDYGASFDNLIFENTGGPVRDFYAQQVSFLQITAFDSTGKIRDVWFYPWWYYGPFEMTKAETGTLATFSAVASSPGDSFELKWRSQAQEVMRVQEEVWASDESMLRIEPCIFFSLTYSDLLGNQHEALVHLEDRPDRTTGFTTLPNSLTWPLFLMREALGPPTLRVPELAELLRMREYLPDPREVFGPIQNDDPFLCYPRGVSEVWE